MGLWVVLFIVIIVGAYTLQEDFKKKAEQEKFDRDLQEWKSRNS